MINMPDTKLKPGSFYWVKPVFDVDFTPPDKPEAEFDERYDHWTQQEQPARFSHYTEHNEEVWVFLGIDEFEAQPWPVCWVGAEIKQ